MIILAYASIFVVDIRRDEPTETRRGNFGQKLVPAKVLRTCTPNSCEKATRNFVTQPWSEAA
jgi:hypothetical protein